MKIQGKYFLEDIRAQYDIDNIVADDGYVYCRINRGMYGLKQAAKLARDQLIDNLAPYGYFPDKHAQNIWLHKTKKTKFCLCVDDFGIKYHSEEDIEHFINALKTNYEITTDKKGEDFCGLHFTWNYKNKYVDVAMPNYVQKALIKLNHEPSKKPQHAPHKLIDKNIVHNHI